MKKFNEFRESAADDAEEIRAKAERRAMRKQKQQAKLSMPEEAVPVDKPKKEDPTANHPAEDGVEGDSTPPKQGSSEDPKLTHMCAMKVAHPKFGEGKPMHSEHAMPDADGNIAWYKVMFEHGIETCETYSLDILEEGSHGNHKKKGY